MINFLKVACFLWFGVLFVNGRLFTEKFGPTDDIIKVILEEEEHIADGIELEEVQMLTEGAKDRINVGHSHREYPTVFRLDLNSFNSTFSLKMKANDVLMGAQPKLIYYDQNGTRIVEDDHDEVCCYYQGYDVNMPSTTAAISVCDGSMDGVIMTGQQQFVIKPSKKEMFMKKSGDRFTLGPHVLKESVAHTKEKLKLDFVNIPENLTDDSRSMRSMSGMTETKYVELYLLADNSFFVWMERSVEKTTKRLKQVTNIVDSLYSPLNVRVILIGLEIWTDSNKMTIDNSIENTLGRMYNYRYYNVLPIIENDCTILVSGVEFDGPAIGLAPLNGMCNSRFSVNVCQDTRTDLTILAGTMAHELGHNLGMEHDNFDCRCPYYACLMSPYSQDPMPKRFSECSEWNFQAFLKKRLAHCLMNVPDFKNRMHIDDKTCGNNKLDPGEECDCGKPRYCQNPCCDAFRCRLKKTSQCYKGGCCVDCKIQTRGVACRRSIDYCDFDELCDGKSPECPADAYLPNGDPCREYSKNGYCYDGQCRTLQSQCRYVWGGVAKEANSVCYNTLNTRGDQRGNCGYAGGYIPCATADAMCGRLFCTGLPAIDSLPIIGFQPVRYTLTVNGNGEAYECVTARVDLGRNAPDPISIFTGVKCGDGRACKAGKCSPVSEIASPVCMGNCHGNGFCTHLGTCMCDYGFAPPYCDKLQVVDAQSNCNQVTGSLFLAVLVISAGFLLI